jgi:TetR/AcrR family transcriptional regulator
VARAAQREQTRERIVDAAVAAFADLGFRAASTRDIASRAGVTQGLVTYHFTSKEDLWFAAADRIFAGFREEVLGERGADGRNPRAAARDALRRYVRFVAHHPELIRFMIEEGKVADDRMRWLVERHLRPVYRDFEPLVDAVFPSDRSGAAHLYYAIAGASSLVFAVAPECMELSGMNPLTDEQIELHADLVVRLFLPD